MLSRKTWAKTVTATVMVACLTTIAPAQSIVRGGTARQNARTAAGRSPGNMVSAGIARAQDAIIVPLDGSVSITDTSRTPSIGTTALVETIRIFFEQLNEFLLFLGTRLFQRAGLDAVDLTPTPPPDTSTDGTPDTDTDTGGRTPRR